MFPATIINMDVNTFSKKEAIKFGWNTTLKNLTFLVGITLVMGIIQFLPDIFESYTRDQSFLQGLISIIAYVVSLGITLGSIKIYLSLVDGKKAEFSDLFSLFKANLIWKYFLATTIYGIAVVLGVFLLIIPGIYIAIKYAFFTFFIVDKNTGVLEAFSRSGEITKNRIWNLFLFEILVGLVLLAGAVALLLGLFVAMPTVSLATAYIYRKLTSNTRH
jgi:uncharacterized membrane protein